MFSENITIVCTFGGASRFLCGVWIRCRMAPATIFWTS